MSDPDILFEAMEVAAAAEEAFAAGEYGLPECRDDLRFYAAWASAAQPASLTEWAMVPVAVRNVLAANQENRDVREELSLLLAAYVGAVIQAGGTYGGAAVVLHDSVDEMRAQGRTGFAETLHGLLCRGSCWGRKQKTG